MGKKVDESAIDDLKPVIPEDDPGAEDIPAGFSRDEWNDLSDEEREGILSQEDAEDGAGNDDTEGGTDVDMEILEKVAEGAADEDSDGDTTGDTKGDIGEPVDSGADTTPKPSLDSFDEPPRIQPPPLEISNEVPEDIKAKIEDLTDKFEAGEISVREYNDQRDALNRETWQRNMQSAQEAQALKTWEAEQHHFLGSHPEYTEDTMRSRVLLSTLDSMVRELANDPANATKSGYQILQLAHKEVQGIVGGKADNKTDTGKQETDTGKSGKPPAKKPDIKTLGEVPASSANITEDPFAAIDKLEGEAYEDALSKMTDAQAKAYRARA